MLVRITIMAALAALACCAAASTPEHEWGGGRWLPVPPAQSGTPEGDLAIIRAAADARQHSRLVSRAKDFLKKYPDAPQREQVYSLYAQAQINRGLYWQAHELYQKQLQEFPAGALADRALQREYFIGDAFLRGRKRVIWGIFRLSAYDEGVDILQQVAQQAPAGELAQRSLMRIAEFHFQKRQFVEAAGAYDRYVEQFPASEGTGDAMLQAARSTLLSYRDYRYDPTPLIEARQRLDAFSQRFPVAAQHNNVPQMLTGITDDLAEQDYQTARFYERVHRPAAAGFYYRQVLMRYPDSARAADSGSALDRLNLPRTPAAPASAPANVQPTAATRPPASAPAESPATRPMNLEELSPPAPEDRQ
jgi:outer membrane protein assembly factor BamD